MEHISNLCGSDDIDKCVEKYWDLRANGYSVATIVSIGTESDRYGKAVDDLCMMRGASMLDVGCGAGLMSIIAAKKGYRVTGIDSSKKMIERARINSDIYRLDARFVEGDASEMPFEDGFFDAVIAKDALWTMTDPITCYREMSRVLKPGGVMLIMDGNYYLDLFDQDFKKKKNSGEFMLNGLHSRTNVDKVDMDIISDLASWLPMCRLHRPSADVDMLQTMDVEDISMNVRDRNGEKYPGTPFYFTIRAKKKGVYPGGSNTDALDPADRDCVLDIAKSLSDKKRLAIVLELMNGDRSVMSISKATGCSQSLTSHNIRILKDCGLVTSERVGKETMYGIADRKSMIVLLRACGSLHG